MFTMQVYRDGAPGGLFQWLRICVAIAAAHDICAFCRASPSAVGSACAESESSNATTHRTRMDLSGFLESLVDNGTFVVKLRAS